MVQEPAEERMSGRYEAVLMEGDKGDDVPGRRHQLQLSAGEDPFLRRGERAQETLGHQAVQARDHRVGVQPG